MAVTHAMQGHTGVHIIGLLDHGEAIRHGRLVAADSHELFKGCHGEATVIAHLLPCLHGDRACGVGQGVALDHACLAQLVQHSAKAGALQIAQGGGHLGGVSTHRGQIGRIGGGQRQLRAAAALQNAAQQIPAGVLLGDIPQLEHIVVQTFQLILSTVGVDTGAGDGDGLLHRQGAFVVIEADNGVAVAHIVQLALFVRDQLFGQQFFLQSIVKQPGRRAGDVQHAFLAGALQIGKMHRGDDNFPIAPQGKEGLQILNGAVTRLGQRLTVRQHQHQLLGLDEQRRDHIFPGALGIQLVHPFNGLLQHDKGNGADHVLIRTLIVVEKIALFYHFHEILQVLQPGSCVALVGVESIFRSFALNRKGKLTAHPVKQGVDIGLGIAHTLPDGGQLLCPGVGDLTAKISGIFQLFEGGGRLAAAYHSIDAVVAHPMQQHRHLIQRVKGGKVGSGVAPFVQIPIGKGQRLLADAACAQAGVQLLFLILMGREGGVSFPRHGVRIHILPTLGDEECLPAAMLQPHQLGKALFRVGAGGQRLLPEQHGNVGVAVDAAGIQLVGYSKGAAQRGTQVIAVAIGVFKFLFDRLPGNALVIALGVMGVDLQRALPNVHAEQTLVLAPYAVIRERHYAGKAGIGNVTQVVAVATAVAHADEGGHGAGIFQLQRHGKVILFVVFHQKEAAGPALQVLLDQIGNIAAGVIAVDMHRIDVQLTQGRFHDVFVQHTLGKVLGICFVHGEMQADSAGKQRHIGEQPLGKFLGVIRHKMETHTHVQHLGAGEDIFEKHLTHRCAAGAALAHHHNIQHFIRAALAHIAVQGILVQEIGGHQIAVDFSRVDGAGLFGGVQVGDDACQIICQRSGVLVAAAYVLADTLFQHSQQPLLLRAGKLPPVMLGEALFELAVKIQRPAVLRGEGSAHQIGKQHTAQGENIHPGGQVQTFVLLEALHIPNLRGDQLRPVSAGPQGVQVGQFVKFHSRIKIKQLDHLPVDPQQVFGLYVHIQHALAVQRGKRQRGLVGNAQDLAQGPGCIFFQRIPPVCLIQNVFGLAEKQFFVRRDDESLGFAACQTVLQHVGIFKGAAQLLQSCIVGVACNMQYAIINGNHRFRQLGLGVKLLQKHVLFFITGGFCPHVVADAGGTLADLFADHDVFGKSRQAQCAPQGFALLGFDSIFHHSSSLLAW